MASHGRKRHVKRLAAPKYLRLARKMHKYLKKTGAGGHGLAQAAPLLVLVRDLLGLASSKREAKAILSAGDVLVDGVPRKEEGFPVGLMDVVSIPKLKKNYRMLVSGDKLLLQQVSEKDALPKLCKVVGKKLVAGNRIQLAFHDGRTHLIEREEDRFSLGDTVKLALPQQKLEGFLKCEKGARCYVYKGRHAGAIGVLKEVLERPGSAETEVRLDTAGGEIITHRDYVFVVDDSFEIKT